MPLLLQHLSIIIQCSQSREMLSKAICDKDLLALYKVRNVKATYGNKRLRDNTVSPDFSTHYPIPLSHSRLLFLFSNLISSFLFAIVLQYTFSFFIFFQLVCFYEKKIINYTDRNWDSKYFLFSLSISKLGTLFS